jgi:chromosome segregation ATPase
LRDLDVEEMQSLRRRQAALPEEIYAARLVELAGGIERLRAEAAVELIEADALGPELEAAETRLQEAKAERDRIAGEIRWHRADAQEAERNARAREGELENLAAEMADAGRRLVAPVVRSLPHAH